MSGICQPPQVDNLREWLALFIALAALHFGLFAAPWPWLPAALWLGLIAGVCFTAVGMLGSYLKHRN
jgi:hypothetical protein